MKIAVFHNLPPGGAKRVLYEEVRYLSQKHTVDLFEFKNTDEGFLDIKKFCKNVYLHEAALKKRANIKRLFEDLFIIYTLKNAHKDIANKINMGGYDCVLVHPDKFTQAPYVLRYLSVPSVYYCHEWLRIVYEKEYYFKKQVLFYKLVFEKISRFIKKRIDFHNARSATKILTNSKFTQGNIKKAYDKDSIVLYPGVDAKTFKYCVKKTSQILFIGDNTFENGFELLNSALKIVNQKFTLKMLNSKNIKNVSEKKIAREYGISAMTVCLSPNEPFGLSVIESFSCGTPVIALDQGGYKETVLNNTGKLIKNKEQLSQSIDFYINNLGNKKISEACHKYAKEKWSWEIHNQKLERILINL